MHATFPPRLSSTFISVSFFPSQYRIYSQLTAEATKTDAPPHWDETSIESGNAAGRIWTPVLPIQGQHPHHETTRAFRVCFVESRTSEGAPQPPINSGWFYRVEQDPTEKEVVFAGIYEQIKTIGL